MDSPLPSQRCTLRMVWQRLPSEARCRLFEDGDVQTALLTKRIEDAALAGCDLVVTQAGLLTTSQHNMERCGLGIAFNRAVWGSPIDLDASSVE